MVYYNEYDPKAAAWLRELIRAGVIADGDVDERSICDVTPSDLRGYVQHHFFAGIGGWSLALRLAGWPDSRPVRTGSCPCQPFSAAGKQLAEKDERHLWPVFRDLITFGEPTVTFGEQVASALGRQWLAGVRTDLEGLGYAVGAADLCAASASPDIAGWLWIPDELEPHGGSWIPASAGPPHIRQRLFWVANPNSGQRDGLTNGKGRQPNRAQAGREQGDRQLERDRAAGGVADGNSDGLNPASSAGIRNEEHHTEPCGADGRLGDANQSGPQGWNERGHGADQWASGAAGVAGFWSAFDLIPCADGKARRVEPGSFPLVTRLPAGMVPGSDPSVSYVQASAEGRVMRLRGYGNAIIPELAAEFIKAYAESV